MIITIIATQQSKQLFNSSRLRQLMHWMHWRKILMHWRLWRKILKKANR